MFNMDGINIGLCPGLDTGVPVPLGGSPASANSSDIYLYDDSSMSDGSLYASDQENLSTPRKRLVKFITTSNIFLVICSCVFLYLTSPHDSICVEFKKSKVTSLYVLPDYH